MNKKVFLSIFFLVAVVAVGAYWSMTTQYGTKADNERALASADAAVTRPSPTLANPTAKDIQKARKALGKLKPVKYYIVINTHDNKLTYRSEDSVIFVGECSTGSGGELTDSATGRKWMFDTPRGVFKIKGKLKEPWWRKPDWAFIEEGEAVPKNDQERLDPNVMGDYALDFGDGYFIHGTIYERLLGVGVTHGCVRLGSKDLDVLYKKVQIGTPVYIF